MNRQSDRRTGEGSVITERRQSERRVSPAVGEFAIQECVRLREDYASLYAELMNIAMAKRYDRQFFDDDSCFVDWAQNRARAAVHSARVPT